MYRSHVSRDRDALEKVEHVSLTIVSAGSQAVTPSSAASSISSNSYLLFEFLFISAAKGSSVDIFAVHLATSHICFR